MKPWARSTRRGRRRVRAVLALALLAALGACSAGNPEALLKPKVSVRLPAPEALGHPWRASQLLTAHLKASRFTMPVELEVAAGHLTLVGLSGWGTRILTVRYDGRTVHEDRTPLAAGLPPAQQMLADLMLVHWPLAAWQPLLPPGWRLEEADGTRRLLDERDDELVRIVYGVRMNETDGIEFEQRAFGYRLRITTHESSDR